MFRPNRWSRRPTSVKLNRLVSLCCNDYALLTGETPFSGGFAEILRGTFTEEPAPSQLVDIPAAFDDIVSSALAKRQTDRYEHIIYICDDLRKVWTKILVVVLRDPLYIRPGQQAHN